MATKILKIDENGLSAESKVAIAALMAVMEQNKTPDEVKYKMLKNYPDLKGKVTFESEGAKPGSLASRIQEFFGKRENVVNLIAARDLEVEALGKLSENSTIELNLGELDTKLIKGEDEKTITHLQVQIPVEKIGGWAEMKLELEAAVDAVEQAVVSTLKAAQIIKDDAFPRGGKLVWKEGLPVWVTNAESKPRQPRDPNAPVTARSARGLSYTLSYGEGENAVVIGTGIPSKMAILNRAAQYARANGIKKGNGNEFTPKETKPGGFNFPGTYNKVLADAKFFYVPETPKAVEAPVTPTEQPAE